MIRTVSKQWRLRSITILVAAVVGTTASIAAIASGCGTGVILIRDCIDAGAQGGGGGGGEGGSSVCKD
jgi:hypothetical protein